MGVKRAACAMVLTGLILSPLEGMGLSAARAQSVSGVRSFDGGVAPLFDLVGPGNLSCHEHHLLEHQRRRIRLDEIETGVAQSLA